MSVIPKKSPELQEALPPWAPYQGSTLDQLGTLSGPQTPRLLTPPLTTNPGSASDYDIKNSILPYTSVNKSIFYVSSDVFVFELFYLSEEVTNR
jgi:hypothetical protein